MNTQMYSHNYLNPNAPKFCSFETTFKTGTIFISIIMSEILDLEYIFLNTKNTETYRHDSFQLRYIFSNGNIGTDYD